MLDLHRFPDLSKLSMSEQQELARLLTQYDDCVAKEKGSNDFLEFVKVVWPGFVHGNHHRIMADAFNRVAKGDLKRLIINMPPRHTKSEFASVHFPAYYLGLYPDRKIIQCSHTAELAVGFGRKVRDLVGTDLYHKVFDELALKADSKAAGRWNTAQGAEYFAIGIGGAVTGKGADVLIIDDPHALSVTTPIPTPAGFVTLGDLKIGDQVFGPDGLPTVVIGKSEVLERELFLVTTDDGEEIECDGGHLWSYRCDTKKNAKHVVAKSRDLVGWNKSSKPCLPRHFAVQYADKKLPVHPWVLGAWLGDGTSSLGRMTSSPEDMPYTRSKFESFGYTTTTCKDTYTFGVLGLRNELKLLGVLNNKHIPEDYLTASVPQRMALLQGLMDTDGTISEDGGCSFSNYNIRIINGFKELLHGLGLKARIWSRLTEPNGAYEYRINFRLKDAAAMPRKAVRSKTVQDKRCRSFVVTATNRSGLVQCITVDRRDGLFLAGRGYVVTHNSEQEAALAESSPEIYDKVYEWYTSGPRQRLQPGGAIVVVMTRWSLRDLSARLLEAQMKRDGSDKWEVIEFPAIMPSGKALWPEFWPLPELTALKNELPITKWNAQYMQDPTASEGSLIKREWWKVWDETNPPKCDAIISSWDTAFTKTERADYTACTTWGVWQREDENSGKKVASLILLDAWRAKLSFPELKKRALEHYQEWEPDSMVVEGRAAGKPLIYELRAMGVPVQEFNPVRGNDKISRVNAVADIFASGNVWAPDERWAEEVREECASFPAGAHDDFVDTVSQALLRFRQGGWIRTDLDEQEPDIKKRRLRRAYY